MRVLSIPHVNIIKYTTLKHIIHTKPWCTFIQKYSVALLYFPAIYN